MLCTPSQAVALAEQLRDALVARQQHIVHQAEQMSQAQEVSFQRLQKLQRLEVSGEEVTTAAHRAPG